ncbi:hypothetical protein FRB99_001982, partial [Tulasnella sp. 403]
KGSKLTAVIDTCHSGTLLDLSFHVDMTRFGWLNFTNARADMKKLKKPRGTVVCVSACADDEVAHQWERAIEDNAGGDAPARRFEVGALTLALREYFDTVDNPPGSNTPASNERGPVSIKRLIKSLKQSTRLPNQTPWVTSNRKQCVLDFDP